MPPLRIAAIGHVDHGKSTLIGRLLVETAAVDEQSIARATAAAASNKMESWSLAYLVDTDVAERNSGKTQQFTEVACCYQEQELILIDVPGHRHLVTEMITGVADADAVVLVCSASKGELEAGLKGQTYEHLVLARCMGINRLIVAINKIDHPSVSADPERLPAVLAQLAVITKRLNFAQVVNVPISALQGTGLTALLDAMIGSPLRSIPSSQPKQTRITAMCMFISFETLITVGRMVILHSGSQMVDATISVIHHSRPFINKRDGTGKYIKVEFECSQPIDLASYVILRDGDTTIAAGKVV